ncbi:hypothetical protein MASR1M68_09880 [Elusimicrobiota bacterium]|jgi:5-methylcytosine-specific restriction protein B
MENEKTKFTWLPFFNEMLRVICANYDKNSLPSVLFQIFDNNEGGLEDENPEGIKIKLFEFDPLSFIAKLNIGWTDSNRIRYCEKTKNILKLSSDSPLDFYGIPVFDKRKNWFFAYAYERNEEVMDILWAFAKNLSTTSKIDPDLFNKVANLPNIGIPTLSMFLYITYPEKYYPMDRKTLSLFPGFQFEKNYNSFDIFQKRVKESNYKDKKPYELSWIAHLNSTKKLTINTDKNIYKISMSPKYIDKQQYKYCKDKSIIIIGSETPAKGRSKTNQTDTFKTMNIGDFFYLTKGNEHFDVIGQITSDISGCEFEPFKQKGWLQRFYKIVTKAKNNDSYKGPDKWWTPNDNSTCVIIPKDELKQANTLMFMPFFNTEFENTQHIDTNNDQKGDSMNIQPLNQILYGPPGTGKTYETQLLKKYILEEQIGHTDRKTLSNTEEIKNIIKDLTWYEIIALTIYKFSKDKDITVSELSQFEYIQLYYSMKDCKQLNNTLWAQLQIHTSHECLNVQYSNRQEPFLFEKDNSSKWALTKLGINYVEETLKDILYKLETRKDINIDIYNKFFKFITFHQSYSYEDFIESIKPDLDSNDIKYVHKNGIFKQLCLQANKDKDNKYLLVIDEINRGNISKIFGELITLIEEDKRVIPNGEDNFDNIKIEGNSLLATLPYSNEKFGVPANLYIVGTMNTSDRSIASVDIALRRRFKFKEIMPDSKLVIAEIDGVKFKEIFEALNEKITILLDRDHQIGHSYFMPEKVKKYGLKNIWFDEILPLLNEYFYNDWEKLQALLGKATNDNSSFVIEKNYTYEFVNDDINENKLFNFVNKKDIDNDDKFKIALSKILKDTKKEIYNNDN